MKNLITILLATLLVTNLSAQIEHIDYGDGWVIPMNANESLDINDDGIIDFYFNQEEGDLGITALEYQSCLLGTGNYTSFGSLELKLVNPGELVQLYSPIEAFYIEDQDASVFTTSVENGLADGWIDQQDHYIGFALVGTVFKDGWIKLSIDIEGETLTIKEIAYRNAGNGSPGIQVGQTDDVSTSINQLEGVLNNVSVNPNPASNFINLNFDYSGAKNLSLTVLNNIGQEMNRTALGDNRSGNLELNTSSWAQGIYFIRFETADGSYTKKNSIIK